jgi:hypothetical protein
MATPSSVCAWSPGNSASGPGGMTSYLWSITNGTITSASNISTITFVAGPAGNVTLGLTVVSPAGCSANGSTNVAIVPPPVMPSGCSVRTNYFSSLNFTDALSSTTIMMAFDGSSYWSCSGGSSSGVRYAHYDANGVLLGTNSPGLDFRSIFTDGTCAVFARAFSDPTIYRQSSPGVFVSSGVVLTGGSLDAQSSVVLNGAATEFIALSGGTVSRWNTAGQYLGSVALQGFGSVAGEANLPQSWRIAAVGDYWLTHNGAGIVSVWDSAGNRLTQTTLSGAGTSPDSLWSFSYCNGKVFIVDVAGGQWRAWDVCSGGRVAVFGAPGSSTWNTDVQNKIAGTGRFAQVDAFLVTSGNPVPTSTDFRRYQSVLVYSDAGFNSNTNVGNALADYLDLGGGVALATFVFDSSSSAYAIQGRVKTSGYLPFATGGSASSPNMTLVKDLPNHPLLDGVTSFSGGASSYLNTPISLASGATLVAHWSNGQPLIAAKTPTVGRIAGLNFYPPSSDARSDFWTASTDGARLMADALLWAGKAPPFIITPPADHTVPFGSNVVFAVSASGSNPLSYQWRKDGTNIAGATTSALLVNVQTNTLGNYSVIVSNDYGVALSSVATLSPILRFLPPQLQPGGALPLFLMAADGSPISPDRAARVRIYTSADIGLGLPNWTPFPGPLVLINGLLRVDNINAAGTRAFFRAVETP